MYLAKEVVSFAHFMPSLQVSQINHHYGLSSHYVIYGSALNECQADWCNYKCVYKELSLYHTLRTKIKIPEALQVLSVACGLSMFYSAQSMVLFSDKINAKNLIVWKESGAKMFLNKLC